MDTPAKPPRDVINMTPEKSEELMSLISFAMRASKLFMEKLYKTDDFYRESAQMVDLSSEDAKKVFLYGCGREVGKATITLLGNKEHIEAVPALADTTSRLAAEALIDGQNVTARKLIELLTNVINFSTTNSPEAYRAYLNGEKLDSVIGQKNDERDFYEVMSLNTKKLIEEFAGRVKTDLVAIGKEEIWFLNKHKFAELKPSVFSSTRDRYKKALPIAVPIEVVVLGATYHNFFSRTSLSAHPTIGARPEEFYEWESIEGNIGLICLLGINIIGRASELAGFEEDPHGPNKMFRTASAAQTLMGRMNRKFAIGDLVLASDELAEVIDTKTSSYGYDSYKVRFLHRSPLPEIKEDCLKAHSIIPVFARASAREFLSTSKIVPDEVLQEMLKDTDDALFESIKKTLIDLAKRELLIPLLWKSGMIKPTKHTRLKPLSPISNPTG